MNRDLLWGILAIGFAVCGTCYTLYHVAMLANIAPVFVTVRRRGFLQHAAHGEPVANSIPLVTLTTTPRYAASDWVTSRNAFDGTATTTHPASGQASPGESTGRAGPGRFPHRAGISRRAPTEPTGASWPGHGARARVRVRPRATAGRSRSPRPRRREWRFS